MPLFSLEPLNAEALEVCRRCDPGFHDILEGKGVLSFGHRASRTAGQIVTFGRDPDNDVVLPCAGPGPRGNPNNYRAIIHFFFYYAPSGEVILRDMTPRLTEVEVHDVSPDDQLKYIWRLAAAPGVQDALAQQARALLDAPGIFFTSAGHDEANFFPPPNEGRVLRSSYAPTLQTTRRNILFHAYEQLGQGSFGVVTKVVDLATGQLWAVKELKNNARDDTWRQSFLAELETVAPLRHPNIVHLEHFQDFCIGGHFKIFYRLYRGSVRMIMLPHDCLSWSRDPPPWTPCFIDHVLGGLEFLHSKLTLHRDIKPENILFDFQHGSDQPSFYITDFGLSIPARDRVSGDTDAAGTLFYMAPEAWQGDPIPGSDVWSFAVMVGCVLGYWCHGEYNASSSDWNNKLLALGYRGQYNENEPTTPAAVYMRWVARLAMLSREGALPPIYARLITKASNRMSATQCRANHWNQFRARPTRLG